ncbi:MAG: sensor histidine kinase [Candidatus Kariarchaeaceae archaeon]|jgi:signal transduction histidine kinase
MKRYAPIEKNTSCVIDKILNMADIGIIVIDLQTMLIVDANNYFLELVNIKRKTIPVDIYELVFDLSSLLLIRDNGCLRNHEMKIYSTKGEIKHILISGLQEDNLFHGVVRDRSEEVKLIEAHEQLSIDLNKEVNEELILINTKLQNEITERKIIEAHRENILEKLERSNQELKDFAYVVSHDLKAPLRGISSLATWIAEDYSEVLDEEGKENLGLLIGRVRRLNNLIDGILRHSRVGRLEMHFEELDTRSIVSDVIEVLDLPQNLVLTISDLPTITYDLTHLIQIYGNLIGNTLVHSEAKNLEINIGFEETSEYWKFFVQDNGIGIEEQYFDKIFQIFQTLKPRDEKETTGIGLSLVKKIVERHGGKVWVESPVGKGATFYFTVKKDHN